MSLKLTIDGERWRSHLRAVAEANPGLIPVAKGNGYGLGIAALARRCEWLGVDTMAVGTYAEIDEAASRFPGDITVLTPWRPWDGALEGELARRVIHTISRPSDLEALLEVQPGARVILERRTSMLRHGLTAADLWSVAPQAAARARLEGVTIHLPMQGGNQAEAKRLINDVLGAGISTVWVSHLSAAEIERLRSVFPDVVIRPRIGTSLWLGDRGAWNVTARVLDVHKVSKSDLFGYRGRSGLSGHILVVAGGTANGLGLVAPSGDSSVKGRLGVAAKGLIEAAGTLRSPFSLGGKSLEFAEPPHMQASMLHLPNGAAVPEVGDEVTVAVRYTATSFDEVVYSS